MSVWEHKFANDIVGAVAHHLNNASADSQPGFQLIGVYKAAARAANTAITGPEDINHIRSSLCFTCRGDKLYDCDVKDGWSPNCAFIKNNT